MNNNKFSILRRVPHPQIYLDILEKSDDGVKTVNPETGEFYQFTDNKAVPVDGSALCDRFSLQSVARKILKKHRIKNCLRAPVSKNHDISIHKNCEHGSVFYGGLQTCGSVWNCPVCAAKISERRAEEVKQAFDYCKNQGGAISFVTRTVPHTYEDSLQSILDRFRVAETKLKQHRYYKKTMKYFRVMGSIKCFEITVGVNGWHLHVHETFFHESDCPMSLGDHGKQFYESLQNSLYSLWADATMDAGFDCPSKKHGLQVQNGDFAADYFAKFGREPSSNWGVSQEMSKQHIKHSKKGYTPFDLMRLYRDCHTFELEALISEYADVMKGAQQIIWARGFKKLVGVDQKTDKELVEEKQEEAVLLGVLSLDQWRFILKKELRADVLLFAKYHGFEALKTFLLSMGAPTFELNYESRYPRLTA